MRRYLYNVKPDQRYSVRELATGSLLVDAGTVEQVFDGAGLTGRGARQKAFFEAAKGKVVLRVGFDMVILNENEIDRITEACLAGRTGNIAI